MNRTTARIEDLRRNMLAWPDSRFCHLQLASTLAPELLKAKNDNDTFKRETQTKIQKELAQELFDKTWCVAVVCSLTHGKRVAFFGSASVPWERVTYYMASG